MTVARPLDVAISPCPNDTFAFFALSQNDHYRLHYLDIEELNRALLDQRFPVSKGSFAIMDQVAQHYEIMQSGAAIGRGVGPVLVGKIFAGARVALPGSHTTAHRLFHFWLRQNHPGLQVSLTQMPFDRIMPALAAGEQDAAVLIHEGRFVYARAGLALIADLGEWYEQQTGAMIPLGCIYIHRDVDASMRNTFAADLLASIRESRAAFAARSAAYTGSLLGHMQQLAQEQDPAVVEAHVVTYVTDDTVQMGAEALKSVDTFRENCL